MSIERIENPRLVSLFEHELLEVNPAQARNELIEFYQGRADTIRTHLQSNRGVSENILDEVDTAGRAYYRTKMYIEHSDIPDDEKQVSLANLERGHQERFESFAQQVSSSDTSGYSNDTSSRFSNYANAVNHRYEYEFTPVDKIQEVCMENGGPPQVHQK